MNLLKYKILALLLVTFSKLTFASEVDCSCTDLKATKKRVDESSSNEIIESIELLLKNFPEARPDIFSFQLNHFLNSDITDSSSEQKSITPEFRNSLCLNYIEIFNYLLRAFTKDFSFDLKLIKEQFEDTSKQVLKLKSSKNDRKAGEWTINYQPWSYEEKHSKEDFVYLLHGAGINKKNSNLLYQLYSIFFEHHEDLSTHTLYKNQIDRYLNEDINKLANFAFSVNLDLGLQMANYEIIISPLFPNGHPLKTMDINSNSWAREFTKYFLNGSLREELSKSKRLANALDKNFSFKCKNKKQFNTFQSIEKKSVFLKSFVTLFYQYIMLEFLENKIEKDKTEKLPKMVPLFLQSLFSIPASSDLISYPYHEILSLVFSYNSLQIQELMFESLDIDELAEDDGRQRVELSIDAKEDDFEEEKVSKNEYIAPPLSSVSKNSQVEADEKALSFVEFNPLIIENNKSTEEDFIYPSRRKKYFIQIDNKNIYTYVFYKNGNMIYSYELFSKKMQNNLEDESYQEFLKIAEFSKNGVNLVRIYEGEQAWKNDDHFHQFSKKIDRHLSSFRYIKKERNGELIHFAYLNGSLTDEEGKRYEGKFEYAFNKDGECFHRFFKPNE